MGCLEAASRFLLMVAAFAAFGIPCAAADKPLNLAGVEEAKPAPGFLEDLLTRYLPTQMTPTADSGAAQRELQGDILKKVGDDLAKDFTFKTTSVGHFINNVQKYGTQSVNLVKNRGGSSPLRFELEAYRATAAFKYEGIFHSDLSYIAADKNLVFTISKAFTF